MFCDSCGHHNPDSAKHCSQCGVQLAATNRASIQSVPEDMDGHNGGAPAAIKRSEWSRSRTTILWLALSSVAILIGMMVWLSRHTQPLIKHKDKTGGNIHASHPEASTQQVGTLSAEATPEVPSLQTSAAPVRPVFSGITVHPYDLLKDPYTHKGELVQLDTLSIPWVTSGNLVRIQRFSEQDRKILGLYALRFSKMWDETDASYDVLAWNMGIAVESEGTLVVAVPKGVGGDLDRERPWLVELLGTIKGQNAFGTNVDVSYIRFWGYGDKEYGQPSNPTEAAELIDAAVKGSTGAQIQLAIAYARGNGVPQDNCKAAEWFRRAGDEGKRGLDYLQKQGALANCGDPSVQSHASSSAPPGHSSEPPLYAVPIDRQPTTISESHHDANALSASPRTPAAVPQQAYPPARYPLLKPNERGYIDCSLLGRTQGGFYLVEEPGSGPLILTTCGAQFTVIQTYENPSTGERWYRVLTDNTEIGWIAEERLGH